MADAEILDLMDLEKRSLFVMFEIDEMPCEEIAELLGVPVGTVHSRLHSARHEFKNALATISGYAQLIQSESAGAEALDYAGRILEQTRSITHVVTEFLKYARPLEIPDERVPLKAMVERVVSKWAKLCPR